jgi:hypothetical protein
VEGDLTTLGFSGWGSSLAQPFEASGYLAVNRGRLRAAHTLSEFTTRQAKFIEIVFEDLSEYRVEVRSAEEGKYIYGLIVDYARKRGYIDRVTCSIRCGKFERGTDELTLDLQLFEPEPPMPAPLDLNREADKLGLSRAAALKAMRRAAAENATARGTAKAQPKPAASPFGNVPPGLQRRRTYTKRNWSDADLSNARMISEANQIVGAYKNRKAKGQQFSDAEVEVYQKANSLLAAVERRRKAARTARSPSRRTAQHAIMG